MLSDDEPDFFFPDKQSSPASSAKDPHHRLDKKTDSMLDDKLYVRTLSHVGAILMP